MADTVAKIFRTWSTQYISGYSETYTFFKAPYYRVHTGDFHDRQKLMRYLKSLNANFQMHGLYMIKLERSL